MTPATLPTVAVPTDNIPADVSPIPVGSLAPDELTPNSPPRATPAGNVTARLNVPPPPTANDGGLTTQALDAGADDADASCSLTSQPRSSSAPAPKPKRKTDRRPTSFIHYFHEGIFIRTTPGPVWVRQPRVRVSDWTLMSSGDQFRIRPNALRDKDDVTTYIAQLRHGQRESARSRYPIGGSRAPPDRRSNAPIGQA